MLAALLVLANPTLPAWNIIEHPKVNWKVEGDADLGGTPFTITFRESQEASKEEGGTKLKISRYDGQISADGQEIEQDLFSCVAHLDALGRVKSVESDALDDELKMLVRMSLLALPEGEIAEDGKWSSTLLAFPNSTLPEAKGEFQVKGLETVLGEECDIVEGKVSQSTTYWSAQIESKWWLSRKSGWPIQIKQKWSNVPHPLAPGTVSGTFTWTRV